MDSDSVGGARERDQGEHRLDERATLRPVVARLTEAGFYAYLSPDDDGHWLVASDSEAGRIDVRIGRDGYELAAWDVSPGLFLEEEDERRQFALERLARVTIPGLRRGYLEEQQEIWWDEELRGVGARLRVDLPFAAQEQLGAIAQAKLSALNDLIVFIEERLRE